MRTHAGLACSLPLFLHNRLGGRSPFFAAISVLPAQTTLPGVVLHALAHPARLLLRARILQSVTLRERAIPRVRCGRGAGRLHLLERLTRFCRRAPLFTPFERPFWLGGGWDVCCCGWKARDTARAGFEPAAAARHARLFSVRCLFARWCNLCRRATNACWLERACFSRRCLWRCCLNISSWCRSAHYSSSRAGIFAVRPFITVWYAQLWRILISREKVRASGFGTTAGSWLTDEGAFAARKHCALRTIVLAFSHRSLRYDLAG